MHLLPILMVACREMTSGDKGVNVLGSKVDRSCTSREVSSLRAE